MNIIPSSKRLLVGTINGLFGVQGWVKIFSHTQPRKNILSYKPWHTQIDEQWQILEIVNGREQSKTIVAKIKDIDNREQARAMIGIDVYIEKSQLLKLKKGEHYWEDLIGLEVINRSNFVLGKVQNLMETGVNHVLIVQGEKEHWVPYIEPFLCEVNIEKQQILVDWDEDF
ncbi:16S rRNA processing protein RimM [uncultured Gammaproteobacteria bacterium]|jgi:16S rRNA processing protein RimM|uniref:Ribosome maturation factor RimM n=3 Tax=sulfur-oxidizing symbionts TaxID=32036 RepID=A0A1H6JZM7_9GAMM|nr:MULTISPECIES: ribosome maturation factor RimM [sulfur-oxidizing symbionts]CAC5845291.1 16S rRNA processing protein RimM [uncultured Gammaproteobacteria bacterium]CAB5506491.1 16S rRNA processing protein RimM [Bathymodiolus azoricus thioautotrophic gill symbiont]CAB5508220.1 16S rRNA processing protein RimM [Bathymodiolus thermophilus thioautotrophic gill symbiont]CAC9427338.1 16S rRNA processing protein RimM [uncultured Gammaproteobacteria bacterium]CAC9508916.1 16S rRNA processing protein 